MSEAEQFGTGPKKVRGMATASFELIEAMHEIAEVCQPITGRGVWLQAVLPATHPVDGSLLDEAHVPASQGSPRVGHHPVGMDCRRSSPDRAHIELERP